jgi:hypothetical protein|eukprot:CAMPEP_0185578086 /NCGR_PEP_ID=MMETSP0434-20130131/12020_1 /TAXON_ID=626734 ORGANISM="Favella taraikaensis, Strain Fe Narragansett Bay" /NCGR_SAMPLE_ID=MMETSP0434 /ASSEMBLY_ACC=CAM_ASM_000379 /LENGTH=220 /DNA_ID=CAMNT_0028195819 /DNA_START=11 /DNA_END=673 /DNA_ORIENTATION=+
MADKVAQTIDAPPTVEKEQEEDRPPLPEAHSPWKTYLRPYWLTLILNNTKLIFGLVIGVQYLAQFIGAVACINLYSDVDRLKPCSLTGELADGEKSSEVFDMPLMLMAVYHIIEWIRTTVLLTVILIGVNWAIFWYATSLNTLFGLIVYAFAHMAYFDEQGEMCAATQPDRASWILSEIIAFWVMYFFYAFPFVILFCRGKARADASLVYAYEKSEDDEE